MYKHYSHSVGNNLKNIQITTKYRYKVLRTNRLRVCCKVAIEEACKRHKIGIVILRVLEEHIHLMVDVPRTMSDAKLMQLIKGLSSYIIFRLCPELRATYHKGCFWNCGYFCDGVGSEFERAYKYIENQELHH